MYDNMVNVVNRNIEIVSNQDNTMALIYFGVMTSILLISTGVGLYKRNQNKKKYIFSFED